MTVIVSSNCTVYDDRFSQVMVQNAMNQTNKATKHIIKVLCILAHITAVYV